MNEELRAKLVELGVLIEATYQATPASSKSEKLAEDALDLIAEILDVSPDMLRHKHRFYQSLDPDLVICSCGRTRSKWFRPPLRLAGGA